MFNNKTPAEKLRVIKLRDMIADVASHTQEPEEVVRIIVNSFMDRFADELADGRKLRLEDHGVFTASVLESGMLRIKVRPSTTFVD